MKEINVTNLGKLHEFVLSFPKQKDGHTFTIEEAIILGIFAIFNPENIPMPEESIEEFYAAYIDYAKKLFAVN